MDLLYESDQNFGDIEDNDMGDLLESDVFHTPSLVTDNYMDNDWLSSFLEDPVLNDKMITEAVQSPRITSEHSYSLNNEQPGSPLGLTKIEDLDMDFFGSNNHALDLSLKPTTPSQTPGLKPENAEEPKLISQTVTMTTSSTRQPTIILATPMTSQLKSDRTVLPKPMVKQEPMEDSDGFDHTAIMDMILPPTPPGSNSSSSDSDGCPSPHQSAPSSPMHQTSLPASSSSPSSSLCTKAFSQPLFTSPIPQSGILILSEEERRTLVSEGYPIPQKLPLTKQEEKNLKKIRRKIKNKISAQESRRKKKEYLETLEKRLESYNQENTDLKRKVDSLENNNRSLLSQLQKLQALVGKVSRPVTGSSPAQAGSVLMVLVLCFAVFLGGGWSPTSLNIGYSSGPSLAGGASFFANPQLMSPAPKMGPLVEHAKVDAYATPNMKSRVLMSVRDDGEFSTLYEPYGPNTPVGDLEYVESESDPATDIGNVEFGPRSSDITATKEEPQAERMGVVTMAQRVGQPNYTGDPRDLQANLHPDISAQVSIDRGKDAMTEIETA